MKFVKDKDAEDWRHPPILQGSDPVMVMKLQDYIHVIDQFSQLIGSGEITITCYHRKGDKKYHGKLQAADIRTKDKDRTWRDVMLQLFIAVRKGDSRLQFDHHPELVGKPQEHFHIEIDDDSLT